MPRAGRLAALAILAITAGTLPAAAVEPAYGGRLLPAAETAAATVTGLVVAVTRIDQHGYAATLVVDRVLSGGAAPGERLHIAWEELSPARPPRFRDGDAVLVALEPLPSGSLWQQRFAGTPRATPSVVAAAGEAFLVKPDGATVELLGTFLGLSAADRLAGAGVGALARLVADGNTAVAAAALTRLDGVPDLGARITATAAADLGRGLRRDVPRLQLGILTLVAQHRLAALRPAVAAAARPGASLEAPALVALADLDGGLPPGEVEGLLGRREADVRAAAAYGARDAGLQPRLARLVRRDPDPRVRAAAATALLRSAGVPALERVAPAFADRDAAVRTAAARAAGQLGTPAVAPLLTLAQRQPRTGAAVVVALEGIGPEARPALQMLSRTHPDRAVRHLADLALGRAGAAH